MYGNTLNNPAQQHPSIGISPLHQPSVTSQFEGFLQSIGTMYPAMGNSLGFAPLSAGSSVLGPSPQDRLATVVHGGKKPPAASTSRVPRAEDSIIGQFAGQIQLGGTRSPTVSVREVMHSVGQKIRRDV